MMDSFCILKVASSDQVNLFRDTASENGVSNLILEITSTTPEGNISKAITTFKDANIEGVSSFDNQYYKIYFECNPENFFSLNGNDMKTYSLSSNHFNRFSIDQGELVYENNIYRSNIYIDTGDY